MTKKSETIRYCDKCNYSITDYSSKTEFDLTKIHCAQFSLKQIDSVRRQFAIKSIGTFSISLLSLIGASVIPHQSFGQINEQQITSNSQNRDIIKINGLVKDKFDNQVLPFVYITAKFNEVVLAETETDRDGKFFLSIDTSQTKFSEIQIIFSYSGYKEDTLNSKETDFKSQLKELTINLDVKVRPNSKTIEYGNMAIKGIIDVNNSNSKKKKKKK